MSSKQIWLGLELQEERWPAGLEGVRSPCAALLLLREAADFHLFCDKLGGQVNCCFTHTSGRTLHTSHPPTCP